jgi:hydroxyacylglutathione hydrolase
VIFRQFYLPCLAHASYLIGDEATGTAAVVDPQRDTDQYIAFATEHSLKIKHVFLTHLHADFVAGHLELREREGATVYLGAAAKATYPFTPLHDGQTLDFGRVRLKALETPGHTPESISILVYDLGASPAGDDSHPYAVLSGDTLFIGDVGRPDLRAALGWSAAELGGLLFDSLHTKLLALPDDCLVYPAHGAGSLCGKALSKETFSTLGEQRRTNYALQPMTKEAFLQVVTADQPDAPAYFTYDAVRNSEERPTLDETLARVNPMTLDDLLALQEVGAQILDTRDPAEFAAAHLAGSINIGLGGQFATWVGTVLDRDHPGSGTRERIGDAARAHRLRSRGRISERRFAQSEIAAGADSLDGTRQRAICIRAIIISSAARRHRCSHAARARAETSRGQLEYPAQSSAGKSGKNPEGPPSAGLLCGRLPVIHCRESPATQWISRRP